MASARYMDLLLQGFMRPLKEPKKAKAELPIVGCEDCLNWHRKGKHVADAATRKANRLARKKAA